MISTLFVKEFARGEMKYSSTTSTISVDVIGKKSYDPKHTLAVFNSYSTEREPYDKNHSCAPWTNCLE